MDTIIEIEYEWLFMPEKGLLGQSSSPCTIVSSLSLRVEFSGRYPELRYFIQAFLKETQERV